MRKLPSLRSATKVLETGEAAEVTPAPRVETSTPIPNDVKAKANEQIEGLLKQADAESVFYGSDGRGRTISQDMRDYITQPIQRLLQSSNAAPEDFQLLSEARQQAEALRDYWSQVRRLNSNRDIWANFLQANRLNPLTAHSLEVRTLETRLNSLLAGSPTHEWATQTQALIEAYYEERRTIVTRMPRNADESMTPRKTPCPVASSKTSGGDQARLAPGVPIADNYPAASIRYNEEGVVMLKLQIDTTGCATAAGIVGSSGYSGLDAAALELYETMRFLPAESSGHATASIANLPVRYKIND
jgi:TonB family protein